MAVRPPTAIATKLTPPQPRATWIDRPQVRGRLERTTDARLTLVCAPAGWGKSTLLAQWEPDAWLTLGAEDSDPVAFWTLVVEALRGSDPDLGTSALATLASAGRGAVDAALPPLINELAGLGQPLALVLDDYHRISNPDVHESVGFLIDHMPPTLRLAIATRVDPPLPIPRLRASGELTEIRARDLRFETAEAEALLDAVVGDEVSSEDAERLTERTEGWPAGLQLAAMSLRDEDDRRAFIDAFAGDDRHVVDYLATEVLDRQEPEMREFLLTTSILERMNASLCEAVTDRADAGDLLEEIYRLNLFTVALDSRREWYRYHQLFADLLRDALEAERPGEVAELHRRALTWHHGQGETDAAIRHAVQAGDHDAAADLIAAAWEDTFNAGRTETLAGWIDSLPARVPESDPRLAAARAWTELARGSFDSAQRWIDLAEKAPSDLPLLDRFPSMEVHVAMLRGTLAGVRGDVGAALEADLKAVEAQPDPEHPVAALARANLGVSRYYAGQREQGLTESAAALEVLGDLGFPAATAYALGTLALMHLDAGDPDQAEAAAGRSEALIAELGAPEAAWTGRTHLARARLLEHDGDLDGSVESIEQALPIARRGGSRLDVIAVLVARARIERARGETERAREDLREARRVVAACADPGMFADEVERTERALGVGPRRPAAAGPVDDLSDRELEVVRLLAGTLSLREIGNELFVSLNTMKSHARTIYRKLGVDGREQAVARARELNLI